MAQFARQSVKRVASEVASCLPQARYQGAILVLSHMRSATTALSNVLCSHSDVSGYGETHVAHIRGSGIGQVLVNQVIRRAWKPRASHLFDKILHDRLDKTPTPDFYKARAIFIARAPRPSILSIQKLAETTAMKEYLGAEAAATYYEQRLQTLIAHWHRFPQTQRFGLTAEQLFDDPDGQIAKLADWIKLTPQLENQYVSHKATQVGGGGDPTQSAKFTRIEPRPAPPDLSPVMSVSADLSDRCLAAYQELTACFENQIHDHHNP